MDATGVGRPVVDLLKRERPGCLLMPVIITGGAAAGLDPRASAQPTLSRQHFARERDLHPVETLLTLTPGVRMLNGIRVRLLLGDTFEARCLMVSHSCQESKAPPWIGSDGVF